MEAEHREGPAWFVADDTNDAPLIEIVDEIAFDEFQHEGAAEDIPGDPFLRLSKALESAAVTFGGSSTTIALLRALLGVTRMERVDADRPALDALVDGGLVLQSASGLVRSNRFTAQVAAWRDVLRETSEDFSLCGAATLDEWASDVVVRALGGRPRVDAVRRELRKYGVAAFGLVVAA